MTVTEAIVTRRTIREFTNQVIDTSIIIELLEKATMAPNHGFREPWHFDLYVEDGRQYFFTSTEMAFKNIDSAVHEERKKKFDNIQAVIVVSMPQDPRQKQWEEDYAAVAACIQNFQLLACEKEIGVVWKSCQFIYQPWFYEKMKIVDGRKIVAVLYAGHMADIPAPMPRQAIEQKITIWNKKERG